VADERTTALYALVRAERLLTASLGELTLPQLRILRLIARSPERASAIADQAAVSRPSLTGVLDGLEAKGWIRRSDVSGDRRGVRLEVTDDGLAALHGEERTLTDRLDEVLDTLDPHARHAVVAGLGGLAEALDRWHEIRRGAAPG
jgi:DNA-binding MarR family transcriptional regulator